LSSVEKDRDWLSGLFVVGPSGKGICGGSPIVRTLDVSDRQYFKDAVELGQFKISDVITSRVTGQPIVAGVLPLFDKAGVFEVALGAGIKLDWIGRIATEANANFSGVLIVLDGNG